MSVSSLFIRNDFNLFARSLTVDTFNSGTTSITSASAGTLLINGGLGVSSTTQPQVKINYDNSNYATIGVNSAGTMTVDSSGNNIIFDNNVVCYSTLDTTVYNSGALRVLGGVGVAKNLYVGENLNVEGNVNIQGTLTVPNLVYEDVEHTTSTSTSTSISTGSLIVDGGAGIAKDVYIGGIQYLINTTDSTDISTGTLISSGGIGISKNINIGGYTNMNSQATVSSTTVPQLYIKYDGYNYSSLSTNGTGVLTIDNTGNSVIVNNPLVCYSTTNTTVSNAGSLRVIGGAGIGGNTVINGKLMVLNTSNSTSTSTGSMLISGGVGVSNNIYCGGNFIIDISRTISETIQMRSFYSTLTTTALGSWFLPNLPYNDSAKYAEFSFTPPKGWRVGTNITFGLCYYINGAPGNVTINVLYSIADDGGTWDTTGTSQDTTLTFSISNYTSRSTLFTANMASHSANSLITLRILRQTGGTYTANLPIFYLYATYVVDRMGA